MGAELTSEAGMAIYLYIYTYNVYDPFVLHYGKQVEQLLKPNTLVHCPLDQEQAQADLGAPVIRDHDLMCDLGDN